MKRIASHKAAKQQRMTEITAAKAGKKAKDPFILRNAPKR